MRQQKTLLRKLSMAPIKRNIFHDVVDKSLMLWDTIPLDCSIKDSWMQEYAPVQGANVGFSPSIEFDIPPSAFLTHLPSTLLYVKGRIVREDKSKITVPDESNATGETSLQVAPINNILHSMFEHVTVEMNHTPVVTSNLYNYSAYLVNTLGYSKDSKDTRLRSSGMYYDSYSNTEPAIPALKDSTNPGQKSRYALVQSSQPFELLGRPCEALFNVDKLLPSLLPLKITLQRAHDRFLLLDGEKTLDKPCKLYIDECKLRLTYVELPEVIASNLEKKLTAHPISYVIPNQLLCKDYTISQGVTSVELTRLFNNRIPKRLVVAITTNAAKNGSYRLDPFYFAGRNVQRLALRMNDRYVPLKPLTVNYATGNYLEVYNMMNDTLGRGIEDWSPSITFDMFPLGFCFYCWSLTPLGNSEDFVLPRFGELSLTLDFKESLTETLTAICWGEFSKTFTITGDREVNAEDL